MIKESVNITRDPITIITESGANFGKWMHFPPTGEKPNLKIDKDTQQILWCPYCNSYEVFNKRLDGEYECSGVCGWSNTNDYWVRNYNKLWHSGMTESQVSKLNKKKK